MSQVPKRFGEAHEEEGQKAAVLIDREADRPRSR